MIVRNKAFRVLGDAKIVSLQFCGKRVARAEIVLQKYY